ncbi:MULTISPECIES: restriction endonuclease subunit S [Vibrio]|uniref:restriction endonuclease subunit S n=1 Tax=Vibrio TaxID=662 RepID=UPI0022CD7512|nr:MULTISPECIES: restriction endonuclease subunit S [Vibrio]EKO3836328.1 restriction endonuclease subunit S [Vibrio harveyi]MDA0134460.1 restriction endonuclease subunit S [Vibrio sp. NFR]WHP64850.1 restriction endonuclease subunit S [Vibrio harveyi]
MSWPMVAIKSVAKVTTGKTPSKKVESYFGGDIPFITPAELGENQFVKTANQTLTEEGATKTKLVPENSVLVCCIGSLGKLAIATQELATNQQINSVSFDSSKVHFKYGYYALQRLKPILESMAPATTVAIVNKSNFEALEIPLPPLDEQKRIAAILDKADTIRQKRKQAIELADEFLRSVFLDMFGDPTHWNVETDTRGWQRKQIKMVSPLKRGYDLPTNSRNSGNIPIYAANGVNGFHNVSKVKGPGVITGRSGTIGKVVYTEDDFWPLNTALYVTDFFDNSPKYIEWFLRFFRLDRYSQGAGVPTLNRNLFLEEFTLVPPIELQNKFVNICNFLSTTQATMSNEYFYDQFMSLSQKAFSGQL